MNRAPPSTERSNAPGSVIASTVRGSTLSAWITRARGSARTAPSASRRCARSVPSRTTRAPSWCAPWVTPLPVGPAVDPRGELTHPGQRAREGVGAPEPAVLRGEAPGAVGHARGRRDGAAGGAARPRADRSPRARRRAGSAPRAPAPRGSWEGERGTARARAPAVPRGGGHGAGGAARAGGRQQREGERQAAHGADDDSAGPCSAFSRRASSRPPRARAAPPGRTSATTGALARPRRSARR